MKYYICGPMSGMPDLNYPLFNKTAAMLRADGHEVINPAENPDAGSWLGFMRLSIPQVMSVDALYLLPNWETSRGARLEVFLAVMLQLIFNSPWEWGIDDKKLMRKALIYSLYWNEGR